MAKKVTINVRAEQATFHITDSEITLKDSGPKVRDIVTSTRVARTDIGEEMGDPDYAILFVNVRRKILADFQAAAAMHSMHQYSAVEAAMLDFITSTEAHFGVTIDFPPTPQRIRRV